MKYLSIFVLILAAHLNINAQKITESSVPQVVKNNFTRVVPNTTVTQWEMENGNYNAVYIQNGITNSVEFTADGKIVYYKNTIAAGELPEEVKKYFTTNHPEKKMVNIQRIKTVTGSVSYTVEAGDAVYFFDSEGKHIGGLN